MSIKTNIFQPGGQFMVKRRLNNVISTYITFLQRCFNVVDHDVPGGKAFTEVFQLLGGLSISISIEDSTF